MIEEEISRNYQIAVWVLLVKSRTSWKIEEEEKEEKQDKERRAHATNNEYIVQEGEREGKKKENCILSNALSSKQFHSPFLPLSLFLSSKEYPQNR